MAGMDWFRWHHGSVTDPKFQLVARKTKSRVADVIAVWAFVLEAASQSDARGNHGTLDFESIDCALGLEDGQAYAIHTAMAERWLITADGRVASWEKRQPKREREDDNSTERSREYRQSKRQSSPDKTTSDKATPKQADPDHATPCNAMQRQETPRLEESIGDKRNTGGERGREREQIDSKPPQQAAKAAPPPIPSEFLEVLKTRPELEAGVVWPNFCERYPPESRTLARWRKWVQNEFLPAKNNVHAITTPSATARDPTLVRLDAERALVKPMPENIRAMFAEKFGVRAKTG
jgi:hypothetical protein